MLISIFLKDECNFICKGFITILDQNLSILIFKRLKKKLTQHVENIFLLSNQKKTFLFFCFAYNDITM